MSVRESAVYSLAGVPEKIYVLRRFVFVNESESVNVPLDSEIVIKGYNADLDNTGAKAPESKSVLKLSPSRTIGSCDELLDELLDERLLYDELLVLAFNASSNAQPLKSEIDAQRSDAISMCNFFIFPFPRLRQIFPYRFILSHKRYSVNRFFDFILKDTRRWILPRAFLPPSP